jgi:hypothetical protein
VRMCLDRAKKTKLPLRLAAEPAAHEFWLKMGFEDTKHVEFDLEKWAEPHTGFGTFRLFGMVTRD